MSTKEKNFRHVDEWQEALKSMADVVVITGLFFKHGQKMHVQRATGSVSMVYQSVLPDGSVFTSQGSKNASWDWAGHCRIGQRRCSNFDIHFLEA